MSVMTLGVWAYNTGLDLVHTVWSLGQTEVNAETTDNGNYAVLIMAVFWRYEFRIEATAAFLLNILEPWESFAVDWFRQQKEG